MIGACAEQSVVKVTDFRIAIWDVGVVVGIGLASGAEVVESHTGFGTVVAEFAVVGLDIRLNASSEVNDFAEHQSEDSEEFQEMQEVACFAGAALIGLDSDPDPSQTQFAGPSEISDLVKWAGVVGKRFSFDSYK